MVAILDPKTAQQKSRAVAGVIERCPLPEIKGEDDDWDDWLDGDEHADSDAD